ncbi:MAG TPA: hypothetical protein VGE04_02895, partial [Chloroflexia bacterium]
MRVVDSPHREGIEFKYDVLVYAQGDIPPGLNETTDTTEEPAKYNGWRLRARETISLSEDATSPSSNHAGGRITYHFATPNRYLQWFRGPDQGRAVISNYLRDLFSPGLRRLGEETGLNPLLIWWDCASPAMTEMPWELAFYRTFNNSVTLLRGVPPQAPRPPTVFYGKLRLAVIGQHEDSLWNSAAWLSLENHPLLEVHRFDGIDPILALQKAAQEGFELVHLFSRGEITSAFDGVLYLNDGQSREYNRELTSGHLSEILRYGRVALVSLTSNAELDDTPVPDIVATHRAFAALGRTPVALPSVLAPLGYLPIDRATAYFVAFYDTLSATGDLGYASNTAQRAARSLTPVAVFPRRSSNVITRKLSVRDIMNDSTLSDFLPAEVL